MKNLRILFMGTPEFAVHILAHLLAEGNQIVGVVTAPDKPSGRGQKIRVSAVKKYAEQQGLKLLQPTRLKSDRFQSELKALNPDIAVVVAFRMLPEKVWRFPKYGTFNLHASLLPDYRGAAPLNWALINGESTTGVTTFFLDEKIDTGNLILQKEVPISPTENVGELHDKLMQEGALLVQKTLDQIAKGTVKEQPQPEVTNLKPAPKLHKQNTKIDWTASLQDIYNLVRGLSPYPVAWTYFKNGKKEVSCKIYAVEMEKSDHNYPIGKLIKTKTELKVAVDSGFIKLKSLQMPGKKKLPANKLLNGLRLEENACMR